MDGKTDKTHVQADEIHLHSFCANSDFISLNNQVLFSFRESMATCEDPKLDLLFQVGLTTTLSKVDVNCHFNVMS